MEPVLSKPAVESEPRSPILMHILDDAGFGGVAVALASLADSDLQHHYSIHSQFIDLTKPKFTRVSADIICLHNACSWKKLVGLLCLKLANWRMPILLQEHHYCREFVHHQVSHPRRFLLMLKLCYRLVDRVLAVSPNQGEWMIEQGLLHPHKLWVTGQARDMTYFISKVTPEPENPELNQKDMEKSLILAAYGRLHYQKGFDVLVSAMGLLEDLPIKLKLAGDGEQAEMLTSMVHDMDNIELVGRIDDIPGFLRGCDAVVIPSRWEPFGLTCLESIAAGKAIICSSVDGLSDQIEQHSNHHEFTKIEVVTAECIAAAIRCYYQQFTLERRQQKCALSYEQGSDVLLQRIWSNVIKQWKAVLSQYIQK